MIVAVTALVVACSGSAVAGSLITGKQIAKSTITGKNIKNGSITLSDISKKTRAALTGAPGAPGSNGANGANGKDGTNGVIAVTAPSSLFEAKRNAQITASGALLPAGAGDNSILGDAVIFHGFDGKKLKDLASVSYTASYHHTPGPGDIYGVSDNADAPYMLITFDNDSDHVIDHDIAFTPSTQPGACYGGGGPSSPQCKSSDRMIHYRVSEGTVRYDDDPGSGPDYPWDRIVADHGDDVINGIRVQAGNSLPGTENAIVNSLTVEAKGAPPLTYFFGTP
jgi:hypothetical protein